MSDVSPKTIKRFKKIIELSDLVIWNGPLGAFELRPFIKGTKSIAKFIASFNKNKKVIVGGGDTASAIINMNYADKFTHISTGGGASLELLSGQKLKVIKSWEKYE